MNTQTIVQYYRPIQRCVNYQAYEFSLDKGLTQPQYEQLRLFVQTLGKNRNPTTFNVLHIRNQYFFLDFPSYGFPTFKISFYKHISKQKVEIYLDKINDYMHQLYA